MLANQAAARAMAATSKEQKLNLSGLLNCLDGVIDTPDRMIIMTSNHPKKLDPALIRPGRIDKLVEFGYLDQTQAIELLRHYFSDEEMTEQQKLSLKDILEGGSAGESSSSSSSSSSSLSSSLSLPENSNSNVEISPADAEQICAETNSLDDFLIKLAERVAKKSKENKNIGNLPNTSPSPRESSLRPQLSSSKNI
jgi:chaperone BCS1